MKVDWYPLMVCKLILQYSIDWEWKILNWNLKNKQKKKSIDWEWKILNWNLKNKQKKKRKKEKGGETIWL